MDKKGFELAISTLIIIILGMFLLIGFIWFVTDGFGKLKDTTVPLLVGTDAEAVKQACKIACSTEDRLTYCCKNFEISNENFSCSDSRLELGCSLSCAAYSCLNNK